MLGMVVYLQCPYVFMAKCLINSAQGEIYHFLHLGRGRRGNFRDCVHHINLRVGYIVVTRYPFIMVPVFMYSVKNQSTFDDLVGHSASTR
jgi:hypothetical protein